MPSETPELQLHKKDPATDGEQNFDIKTMMNDNWDKLDARALLERAHRESKSNPHNTTAAQVGAYTKAQTDTLIQEKADAAKTTAIDFAKSFGVGGTFKPAPADLNNAIETGFYYAVGETLNKPMDTAVGNGYVINIRHSANNQTQIFVIYNTAKVFTRIKNGGVWYAWIEQETTAGAQSKATAAETAAKTHTDTHVANKNNPHNTTAAQVGAYTKTEADNRYETPNGAQSKA
ncbi:pyocin knob domain-containing protein, partial [Bacillus inaquosorum]